MNQLDNTSEVVTLNADREHSGIQLLVPLIMVVASILTYLVINPLVLAPLLGGTEWESFRPFLRIILSITLGVGIGGIAEGILKERWPSGRMLHLDSDGITIQDKDKPTERIEWKGSPNVLLWNYILRGYPRGGRERRLPAGYYLMAGKLVQNDCQLHFHSYMKHKQAESTPGYSRFSSIDMASIYKSKVLTQFSRPLRPTIPTNLLAGPKGKVWAAEKERWVSSFELEPDDFMMLLSKIEQIVSKPVRHGS